MCREQLEHKECLLSQSLGLKDLFLGKRRLFLGEIAEDFATIFAISEQIPSAVGLSVLVNTDDSIKTAGGFMINHARCR